MPFNTYVFVLAFLPISTALYYLINKRTIRFRAQLLTVISLVFYAYSGWKNLIILLSGILVNYSLVFLLRKQGKASGEKGVLALSILANVGLLLFFKYANFLVLNINELLHTQITFHNTFLPLGISFIAFQQISYLMSVYRGEDQPSSFIEYSAFILFYPKLLMGPLMTPEEFFVQLRDDGRAKANADNIRIGIQRFVLGLFKKLLLADTFAKAVAWSYQNTATMTSGDVLIVMLSYTFQIYFDFSGFSDMAIGISRMLNFQLPENFNSPYQAPSIRDFWKRWHMSLTRFLTRNIYIPLGGNRKGELRTYINTLAVFVISGIWHGANWTFVLWGLLNGLLSAGERWISKRRRRYNRPAIHPAAKWLYAFTAVNVLWLLFMAESVPQWATLLKRLLSFGNMQTSAPLLKAFVLPELKYLLRLPVLTALNKRVRGFPMLLFLAFSLGACLLMGRKDAQFSSKPTVHRAIITAIGLIWCLLSMSGESTFIYFGF